MQHTSLSRFYLRCARYLIELYPASWRERYSEEMLLLLDDFPPTSRTVINLLFHLFDAYAHPHLLNGRFPPVLQRMRSSELTIYSAAVIFFVAWSYALLSAMPLIRYSRNLTSILSFLVIFTPYASLLLVLLILLGSLPMLLATSWKALKARKYHVLLFLWLCLMPSAIIFFLIEFFGGGMSIAWVIALMLVSSALSMALMCMVIQNVTPSRRVTHLVLYVATPLPLFMLVGCASILFYVVSAITTGSITSYLLNERYFFWFSTLCLMFLIMVVTCSFSLFSLLKGFQAKNATQQTR
jgi:hypothetical protein